VVLLTVAGISFGMLCAIIVKLSIDDLLAAAYKA
jgi:hypothetical protein